MMPGKHFYLTTAAILLCLLYQESQFFIITTKKNVKIKPIFFALKRKSSVLFKISKSHVINPVVSYRRQWLTFI